MLFNIIFKQYLNIFIRNFVLCIQIRFVSTEKTTRIASRASCSVLTKRICMHKTKYLMSIFKYCFKNYIKLHEFANYNSANYDV